MTEFNIVVRNYTRRTNIKNAKQETQTMLW